MKPVQGRFVAFVFAALFVLAQQGAAVHAIDHLAEFLEPVTHPEPADEPAHKCPDCARLASLDAGAAAGGCTLPCAAAARDAAPDVTEVFRGGPQRERPRNRSPPSL